MRALLPASLLLSAPLVLSACASSEPDFEPGVCYHVNEEAGEQPAYNVLVRDQPQIEYCAARLEEMRVQFLRLGGSKQEITGAYQGRYIFINREGVSFAQSLNGAQPTPEQATEMQTIVAESGLEVERFNAIGQASAQDESLRARIALAQARAGE